MKVLHDEFAEEIPISESRALSITFEAHNIEFNSGDIFEKLTKDLQRVHLARSSARVGGKCSGKQFRALAEGVAERHRISAENP